MDISVIIPCHNAENYLAQTLGSLLNQTRLPEEILIVDDGSTDGSMYIAKLFESAAAGRIRVYTHRSASAAKTRSIGADLARGDLLMFLDADDVLDPLVLEGLSEVLYDEPNGVAVSQWKRLEFQNDRWISRPPSCRPWSNRFDLVGNWLRGWYYPTSTVLWSRTAFVGTGGWDPASGVNDDGDMMMRALLNGSPLVYAQKGTCFYRRLPQEAFSLSDRRTTEWGVGSRLHVIEKIGFRLSQEDRIDQYRIPIGESLNQLRIDVDPGNKKLIRRIESCRRSYGPSLAQAAGKNISRIFGSGHLVSRKAQKVFRRLCSGNDEREVTYGADRARQILVSSSPVLQSEGQNNFHPTPRPSVTVIIPTYNRALTLERAISSVLEQTFTDYELLVIDDGSTDDTVSLISEITDPRVRYLRMEKNQGVSAARNLGLRQARGGYIGFLDSDDEWMPEKLERQLDLFSKLSEKVGLVYTWAEILDDNGGIAKHTCSARGEIYEKLLKKNILSVTSSTIIRRSVIAAIGFFDEKLPAIEDYDYWIRLSRFFKVEFVPEFLVRYYAPPFVRRKSMDHADNIDARSLIYRRYCREMQRAGVAHYFLLESAGRYLAHSVLDRAGARRLALQAARQKPLSRASIYLILYSLFPCAILARIRDWRHRRKIIFPS